MLLSLGIVISVGLIFALFSSKLGFPKMIGMILAGLLFGPSILNLLSPTLLTNAADFRKISLVIILLKAGMTLQFADIKKMGIAALLMSFLPATLEIIAYVLFAPLFFNLSLTEAALLGTVMAAVSPAVVVPKMVELIEQQIGTKEQIPQLILAGASFDDVFVLVLFATFLNLNTHGTLAWTQLIKIPNAIFLGMGVGILIGFKLAKLVRFARDYFKLTAIHIMLMLLGLALILMGIESQINASVGFSSLLAIICMSLTFQTLQDKSLTQQLSNNLANLWIAAEIILFTLLGSAISLKDITNHILIIVALLLVTLLFRAFGVWLSLLPSKLTAREKIFCIFAYLPKATVQAAIGTLPLAAGLPVGSLVLSMAVLGILITAPLGAFLIDKYIFLIK